VSPSSLPTLSLPGRFPYLIEPSRTLCLNHTLIEPEQQWNGIVAARLVSTADRILRDCKNIRSNLD
jgi:hypothetical protein